MMATLQNILKYIRESLIAKKKKKKAAKPPNKIAVELNIRNQCPTASLKKVFLEKLSECHL